jgi:hypothetical protein
MYDSTSENALFQPWFFSKIKWCLYLQSYKYIFLLTTLKPNESAEVYDIACVLYYSRLWRCIVFTL